MMPYNNPKKPLSAKKEKKVIEEGQKNTKRWYDYWGDNVQLFRNDRDFYNSDQWNAQEVAYYRAKEIEPLVFNLLKPLVRQVVGESKNMQPSINLVPTTPDSVQEKDNQLLQGLLRHIAYGSKSSIVWNTSLTNMCVGGYCAVGVKTEYESGSFEQSAKLMRFADPTHVGFDPDAQEKDKTDGNFVFTYEIMSKEVFEELWPDAQVITGPGIMGSTRTFLNFEGSDKVVVLTYYRREMKNKTLVELTNNVDFKIDVFAEDVETAKVQYLQMKAMSGIPLSEIPTLIETKRRKEQVSKIRCYKMTSVQVLDHYDWVGTKKMPIAFGECLSSFKDGKQMTESFIWAAREPQKVYNYCMQSIVAQVNRLRKNNVWLTPKQVAGHEEIIQNPDRAQGATPYNADQAAPNGPVFGPAQMVSPELFQLAQEAKEDIQAILGVYEANRGELPAQTSALAIGRTITQGNVSKTQLYQNLFDLMQSVGEIVLEIIPKIYDTERVVSLLDETGQQKPMTINKLSENGTIDNDLSKAAYKLEVQPVASFAIQSEFENDFLLKIGQMAPQSIPLIIDLLGTKLESPIKGQVVNRFRTLVPPDILAKENGQPPPPPPPPPPEMQLMQAQIAKLMAEVQSMRAKTALEAQKLQQSQQEAQMEASLEMGRQQIDRENLVASTVGTQIKAETEINKAMIDRGTQHGLQLLKGVQEKAAQRVLH